MTQRDVLAHSFLEFVLTSILLFGVASIVRFVIGPSFVSRTIPNIHLELALVGTAVGLVVAGLIRSPSGRTSGAHMNPAISFAMWRFGVFPAAGVLPYAAAQLAGSWLGVVAARFAWGPEVARPPVSYAVLQPASGWNAAELFGVEMASMAAIILTVGLCLATTRLSPYMPWIVGGLVGLAIALLGTTTGGSDNPARQFGPAVASGQLHFLWVYLTAPMVGAVVAVWLRARIQASVVLTHRLCGTL